MDSKRQRAIKIRNNVATPATSVCLFLLVGCARAFVMPTNDRNELLVASGSRSSFATIVMKASPLFADISFMFHSVDNMKPSSFGSSQGGGGILGGIAVVTTSMAFLAVVFFAFFTNYLIPNNAAEQLENDVRGKYPNLWEEYAAKLGPGETLVTRPDIKLELSIALETKQAESANEAYVGKK